MTRNFFIRILSIVLIAVILMGMFLPVTVEAAEVSEEIKENETTTSNFTTDENLTSLYSSEPGVYHISDETALSEIEKIESDSNNKYILENDIELTDNWEPLKNFEGTFEGGGHTITFNINEETGAFVDTQYLGVITSCSNATIRDLYVNGNYTLTTGGSFFNPSIYIGGIVGEATDSTLENVHFSGNINILTSNDNSPWVGGLVGKANNTQILLSSNTAQITVEANSYVGIVRAGGLCGEFSGTIENCYNKGDLQATAAIDSPYAGGLVGINNGTITKSYNTGKVQSKGPSTSMSDIYAGGIVAKGENGSSVTNCAVMSPEISVTTGWINRGYKYIIANGGNKSNNISINNISGSPTNDSNSRYTLEELKTSEPYEGFDFVNIWTIDGTSNDGYPFQYVNKYAVNIESQSIPEGFIPFIEDGYMDIYDFRQTDDGFTLCLMPISEILLKMGITDNRVNGKDMQKDYFSFNLINDWYLFNIGSNYGMLKMRDGNKKLLEDGKYSTSGVGTAIPFLSFDIGHLQVLNEDLKQGKENDKSEITFYNDMDRLINGKAESYYDFCPTFTIYFNTEGTKANYLIAEEYIRKVISNERDSNGYITLPVGVATEQIEFLKRFPNVYEAENNRIKVKNYNLTYDEKCAILACHTGNKSINNYAAENILHARWTMRTFDLLTTSESNFEITLPDGVVIEVSRELIEQFFYHFVKSDAGIGEEKTPKENHYFSTVESALSKIFGEI